MAVETGTAVGHVALLEALRTFATTHTDLVADEQEWVDDLWALNGTTGEREWVAHGPGLAGQDAIYMGIRTETDAENDRYNWQVMGCTAYTALNGWENQPAHSPTGDADGTRIYLWDTAIDYWFIGSGRRLIVVAKVSTVWELLYLGFPLQYATPNQYPYPLLVGGCGRLKAQRWSAQGDGHRAPIHSFGALQVRMPGGSWAGATDTGTLRMCPIRTVADIAFVQRECPDGTYPLRAQVLGATDPSEIVLGELDGVYHVPGFGAGAGDIIEIDGDDYLVVQDIYRTATYDYCAVRLT